MTPLGAHSVSEISQARLCRKNGRYFSTVARGLNRLKGRPFFFNDRVSCGLRQRRAPIFRGAGGPRCRQALLHRPHPNDAKVQCRPYLRASRSSVVTFCTDLLGAKPFSMAVRASFRAHRSPVIATYVHVDQGGIVDESPLRAPLACQISFPRGADPANERANHRSVRVSPGSFKNKWAFLHLCGVVAHALLVASERILHAASSSLPPHRKHVGAGGLGYDDSNVVRPHIESRRLLRLVGRPIVSAGNTGPVPET